MRRVQLHRSLEGSHLDKPFVGMTILERAAGWRLHTTLVGNFQFLIERLVHHVGWGYDVTLKRGLLENPVLWYTVVYYDYTDSTVVPIV